MPLSAMQRSPPQSGHRRDESTLVFDRRVLFDSTRRHGCGRSLMYELLAPHDDPKDESAPPRYSRASSLLADTLDVPAGCHSH